jgi:hypothetical protein
MKDLIYIEEPNILFAHGQKCTDARDGLSLFGPLNNLYGIKSGVIASKEGLDIFKNYLNYIQKPIYNSNNITRPMFPGFEAVFNCKWEAESIVFKEVTNEEIGKLLYNDSTHKRTYDLVSLFINKIVAANKNEDEKVDVWFVIVPDEIYKYCRPNSVLPKTMVQTKALISKKQAKNFKYEATLFEEINIELKAQEKEAVSYNYDAQFHDQLKARLLEHTIPTQIIRESTLACLGNYRTYEMGCVILDWFTKKLKKVKTLKMLVVQLKCFWTTEMEQYLKAKLDLGIILKMENII